LAAAQQLADMFTLPRGEREAAASAALMVADNLDSGFNPVTAELPLLKERSPLDQLSPTFR